MKKDLVSVLLSNVEGPINLGMICRVMANTGFADLCFSGELEKDDFDAKMFAVHASSILEDADKVDDFDELLDGCDTVIGLSPRSPWDDGNTLEFNELADYVASETSMGRRVGLLFGNEQIGLGNNELSRCTKRLALPTDEGYVSMNLSQAVTVVLWSLHTAALMKKPADEIGSKDTHDYAKGETVNIIQEKLKEVTDLSGYFKDQNQDVRWREFSQIILSRKWTNRESTLLISLLNKIKLTLIHGR